MRFRLELTDASLPRASAHRYPRRVVSMHVSRSQRVWTLDMAGQHHVRPCRHHPRRNSSRRANPNRRAAAAATRPCRVRQPRAERPTGDNTAAAPSSIKGQAGAADAGQAVRPQDNDESSSSDSARGVFRSARNFSARRCFGVKQVEIGSERRVVQYMSVVCLPNEVPIKLCQELCI
jgi:hypothetical protein